MTHGITTPDMRNPRLVSIMAVTSVMALCVLSCTATQPPTLPVQFDDVPGFWKGLWHGFIAPITFIISIFTHNVRIYAVPNVGAWYDFGFMLGIGGFSGGIFAGSRRRKKC